MPAVRQADVEMKEKLQMDPDDLLCSGEDENTERGHWKNQAEFLLSAIGYAVGLGNIWRFPYLCMRNGGGAFLIPYFVFLALCGIPLFYIELILGQFSSLSPISVWRICPLFQGLGWGTMILSAVISFYYNLIISWVLYYLGMSFTKEVPWADCDHPWNTDRCLRRTDGINMSLPDGSDVAEVVTRPNLTELILQVNGSHILKNATLKSRTPAEEFWEFNVLELSTGVDDMGGIRWQLLLCLIAAWVILFFCLIRGIKSSGKVVYVTATVPYIFLAVLLIKGLTLPGCMDGILYYITPDFKHLIKIQTWAEACLQIFYSLGPVWGGIITTASYNKFHHNCLRDSIIIPLVNCGTSVFAGFVIFSIIGFMSHEAGLPVSEVITSGPGLVFMAYPEAISLLPFPPLWAILFFLMLLTVGLDSMFAQFEVVLSGFTDLYPEQLTKRRSILAAFLCVIFFLVGLPFVTRAGLYYFVLVDWYLGMFAPTVIAFLECVVIAWVYGWRRFYGDIEMMLGRPPGLAWRVLWCYITPGLMAGVIVYNCAQLAEPSYGDYTYPTWAIAFGWCLALISLVPIPALAMMQLYRERGTLWQRLKQAVKPAPAWGPSLEKYWRLYQLKQPVGTESERTPSPVS